MPIKCEGCRYFEQPTVIHEKSVRPFRHVSVCTNKLCVPNYFEIKPNFHGLNIDTAREICDREGDGIFVHFEPKDPATGAAFARTAGVSPALPTGVPSPSFVQVRCSDSHCNFTDVFEPDGLGITYYQAVGKCQLCSADTVYEDGSLTRVVVEFKLSAAA